MFSGDKNLKDTEQKSLVSYDPAGLSSVSISLSYTKTNKLITALYMVTDTMEKDEPIRLKLRTFGIEILTDIENPSRTSLSDIDKKISAVLSFLGIASDLRMISAMNSGILAKEFNELKESVKNYTAKRASWFEDFMREDTSNLSLEGRQVGGKEGMNSIGHPYNHSTRIGVQKGDTLMKALGDVHNKKDEFEALRNKRKQDISDIVKKSASGASIKDIETALQSIGHNLGEKTLQRELVSMLKDNVLYKTGEKRWSKYFIKN